MICSDNQFYRIPMPEVKQPRDDFLDAKEAYKATNSIIDKYNTTEIQKIKSEILDTCLLYTSSSQTSVQAVWWAGTAPMKRQFHQLLKTYVGSINATTITF